MRNLVLGSKGFIGSYLCDHLISQGDQVTGIDIKISKFHDLREGKLELDGIDRVYFLAWDVGGAKYLYRRDTQMQQMENNSKILCNIMPQLIESNIPFLFASSRLAQFTDNPYGVAKRMGEIWTLLSKNGIALRIWNAYGSVEKIDEKSHVISDLISKAITTGVIDLMTDGSEIRKFTHLFDICSAFTYAISNHKGLYDILDDEKWISILDIATIIAKLTGANIQLGMTKQNTVGSKEIGRIPGWKNTINLEDGIRKMVDQYKGV